MSQLAPVDPKLFTTGRWLHARAASLAQVVMEFILFIVSCVFFWWFGAVFAIFGLTAAANTLGACCCRDKAGKPVAVTHLVLMSIALIGSLVDVVLLGAAQGVCDQNRYVTWGADDFCDRISGLFAVEIICMLLRVATTVLAGRVCCFRPADWSVPATTVVVEAPTGIVNNHDAAPVHKTMHKH